MKDSFIFHFENIEDIEDLTLEEQGMIFRAMISFAQTGVEPGFEDRFLQAVWKPIRRRMVKDKEAYMAKCQANRENGARGGRPKNPTIPDKNPDNPTVPGKNPDNPTVLDKSPKNPTVPDKNPDNPTVPDENPKNPTVFLGPDEKPKKPDTDTDTDTDTDIERDKTRARGADPIPYVQIISYLNQRTGASYSSTSEENRRDIKARWEEGYKTQDFKKVIDNKCEEWLQNDAMAALLRPSTLFGAKFENYLNQPRAKPKNQFLNYSQRDDDLDELERTFNQQFMEIMEGKNGTD